MTRVPFLDLAAGHARLRDDIDRACSKVLDLGVFVLGPQLESFEHEWADAAAARECVGVGNGFDALCLGLRALGVGPGDDVLVPSNTYVATWLAVTAVGATPVAVDPDETGNLDPARLDDAATPSTTAVVPVHLYGQPAAMAPITAWARARGTRVLVDAAQAHGARYRGTPLGGLGDAVAWSFYPSKNLGALGDGGAVTTDDPAVAERVRALRNYGSVVRDRHEHLGVNSRLDELQAAVLRVKLRALDEQNARRAAAAARYRAELAELPLVLPEVADDVDHAWHLFVVRVPTSGSGGGPTRAALQERLAAEGVETRVHYPVPPAGQPAYAGLARPPSPAASRWADEVLSLPIGPALTRAQQDHVLRSLREALAGG